MAKRKYKYTITINSLNQTFNEYIYNYGSTKAIKIRVSKSGICIIAKLTKLYTRDELMVFDIRIFRDAIDKSLLLYLLNFSKGLEIKNINVNINNTSEISISNNIVYPLIVGNLKRNIVGWDNKETIQGILSQSKATYDSRMSALYALICSKNKNYEIERFIYLWMAFNGMYGYFSSLVSKYKNQKKEKKRRIELVKEHN